MSIDYQAIAKAGGIGKGPSKRKLKAKKDREDAKALKAWRDEAWKKQPGGDEIDQWGLCKDCGVLVYRRGCKWLGHVHHKRSRRYKETRTAASNAVILCRGCHNKRHGREF